MKKAYCFNNQTIVLIIFFILNIVYLIIFPHEAFAMDPFDEMMYFDGEYPDADTCKRLIISSKESYEPDGMYTYSNLINLAHHYYPNGIHLDNKFVNDSYDNRKYFDIPLTMIRGESKNIELSGIYYRCLAQNIDGLLI